MTPSHRSAALAAALTIAATVLNSSCASRPQSFKLSFLPSTPARIEPSFEDPPRLASNYYSSETPDLVQRALAAAPSKGEADSLLAKARLHMEAGKRFYQQGDPDGARQEFDAAMDVLLSAPDNLPDRPRLESELDQITDTIYRYDLEGLGGASSQLPEVVYDKSPLDGILDMTFPNDPTLRPKVKEEIEATVSQIPLQEHDAVLGDVH